MRHKDANLRLTKRERHILCTQANSKICDMPFPHCYFLQVVHFESMFLAGLLLMLLNCACALLPRAAKASRREPKGAEGSRTPVTGRQASQVSKTGTFIFPVAPKLANKKQLQVVLPRIFFTAGTGKRETAPAAGVTAASIRP